MTQTVEEELAERRLVGLRYALGPVIIDALNNPEVIEVRLNSDGKLWVDYFWGKELAGFVTPNDAMVILNQVASALNNGGDGISKERPGVSGALPLDGERFQGVAPPVVKNAIFAIRKKATKVFPLSDYVQKDVLSFAQAEALRTAIKQRKNILIAGATKTGKTTFANALLNEVAHWLPKIRMLIMEDVHELQCTLEDHDFFLVSPWTTMRDITEMLMRLSPDCISAGEVRSGAAALEVLKAWNTGHPGGFLTIHADSEVDALIRTNQLIQEVTSSPMNDLIASAVDLVVFLKYEGGKRTVDAICEVEGYDHDARKFITKKVM